VEVKNPMNNTSQRPGDIYMPEFDVFGDAFFDLSVINSCAESYVRRDSWKGVELSMKLRLVNTGS
jgi:hypothetical protein